MNEIRRPVGWRRIAAPLFLLRALGQGFEFVGWIVLARRLGAAPFGALSIGFLIARYVGLIADWGALIGGARTTALDDSYLSSTRALVSFRCRLTIALTPIFVATCLVAGHASIAPVASVIVMLGLSRDWIAVGLRQGSRAGIPLLIQGTVLLCMAQLGPTQFPALAVGFGYGTSAITSIALNRLPSNSPTRATPGSFQPWMLTAMMTNQILSSADILLVGLLTTTTFAGIYSAVYRIPNGWLAGVSILATALLPVATHAADDPHSFGRLRRNSTIVSCSGALLLLLLAPFVYVLLPKILGPEYSSGRLPLVVLLAATAVATGGAPLHQLYLAIGSDRVYAFFLMSASICVLIFGLFLIPAFGMTGAAVATLTAHVLLTTCLGIAVYGKRPSLS